MQSALYHQDAAGTLEHDYPCSERWLSRIPNPLYSDLEHARYYHHDLADMEPFALERELYFVKVAAYRLDPGSHDARWQLPWFTERAARIEAELRRCRADAHPRHEQPAAARKSTGYWR
jgi:hypothetical protein